MIPRQELILCVSSRLIIQMYNLNHITTWLRKLLANFYCLQIKNKFSTYHSRPFKTGTNQCILEYSQNRYDLNNFPIQFCVSLRRLGLQGLNDSSIIQQIVGGVKIKTLAPRLSFQATSTFIKQLATNFLESINQELGSGLYPIHHYQYLNQLLKTISKVHSLLKGFGHPFHLSIEEIYFKVHYKFQFC